MMQICQGIVMSVHNHHTQQYDECPFIIAITGSNMMSMCLNDVNHERVRSMCDCTVYGQHCVEGTFCFSFNLGEGTRAHSTDWSFRFWFDLRRGLGFFLPLILFVGASDRL